MGSSTILKLQIGDSEVLVLAQNAASTCANIRNWRIDQTQDQVQVVDH